MPAIAKMSLEKQIDQRIGEVRTEPLDLSYGEIANLKKNQELIIQPEYQRLFRWSVEQKSRLIESILLELPIPQVFVMENSDGVYELIDGLQRISSVLQFVDPDAIQLEGFSLDGCDIIADLNGLSYSTLPMSLKLRLKRSTLRTIVIKRQSKSFLRYEMFKRLNTGGSLLSPQEIRNCSARMLGSGGAEFYGFLKDLADIDAFKETTLTLAQEDLEQKANEELVLRFFAAKNAATLFRGSVRDWLDDFMEGVLLDKILFDQSSERAIFIELFSEIAKKLGETAFVKYRGENPIGGLAPAYFEAISIGCFRQLRELKAKPAKRVRDAITEMVQNQEFRNVTGPGSNSKAKLDKRIELAAQAIKNS
jgi:Protein of unknown function DUF262